jgi:hypothetical protein
MHGMSHVVAISHMIMVVALSVSVQEAATQAAASLEATTLC